MYYLFGEVEELFARWHVVLRGAVDRYAERRYASLGCTAAGRHLFVIYTVPEPGVAKVITARDMIERERRYYRRSAGRRPRRR